METPRKKQCYKTSVFFLHMSHRQDTHARDSTSMYHSHICSKTQVFVSIFATRMVLSGQELFAIEKMAAAGRGNMNIATTLGLRLSTSMRWLHRLRLEGEMVSHNVGRPPELRVLCAFFSGANDKIRSVLVPHHRSTSGLPPCRVVQSPVFANVCRRLTLSAAAASSRST